MPGSTPDDRPLVVESTTDGLLFVESRRVHPGAFWPVQAIGARYRCTCPAGRSRGRCAHIDAAWAHKPLLVSVPDEDVFDEHDRYTPSGAAS